MIRTKDQTDALLQAIEAIRNSRIAVGKMLKAGFPLDPFITNYVNKSVEDEGYLVNTYYEEIK